MTTNAIKSTPLEKLAITLSDFVFRSACRMRDVLAASTGLIFLAPFFALIAVLIKRDSPGPIWYRGARVGKDGNVFQILKFRTMYDRPESFAGPEITAQGDPRITPLGQWLRDTKINELPQLWNVLKGEMSLIGPRPEVAHIVEKWPSDRKDVILSVRPGITSPASVLFRDEEELLPLGEEMQSYLKSIAPQKIRLDHIYVNNRTYWMDLDVLFWTILVLIPRIRQYKLPEEQLLWGPISRLFRRYLNWFMLDAITAFLAFSSSILLLRLLAGPLHMGMWRLALVSFGYASLFSIVAGVLGVQRIYWSQASALDAVYLLPPVGLALIIGLLLNELTGLCPGEVLVLGSVVVFFGFMLIRYRSRLVTGLASRLLSLRSTPAIARERVLIIGGGEAGQAAAWMIQHSRDSMDFDITGYVDDDIYKAGLRLRGVNVLGRHDDIPALVEKHDIGIIIFAIHELTPTEKQNILELCALTKARVVMMPNFMGKLNTVASILSNIQVLEAQVNNNENKYSQPEVLAR